METLREKEREKSRGRKKSRSTRSTVLDDAEKFYAMRIEKSLNQFKTLLFHLHNFCY